jgi:hypothetical protein
VTTLLARRLDEPSDIEMTMPAFCAV